MRKLIFLIICIFNMYYGYAQNISKAFKAISKNNYLEAYNILNNYEGKPFDNIIIPFGNALIYQAKMSGMNVGNALIYQTKMSWMNEDNNLLKSYDFILVAESHFIKPEKLLTELNITKGSIDSVKLVIQNKIINNVLVQINTIMQGKDINSSAILYIQNYGQKKYPFYNVLIPYGEAIYSLNNSKQFNDFNDVEQALKQALKNIIESETNFLSEIPILLELNFSKKNVSDLKSEIEKLLQDNQFPIINDNYSSLQKSYSSTHDFISVRAQLSDFLNKFPNTSEKNNIEIMQYKIACKLNDTTAYYWFKRNFMNSDYLPEIDYNLICLIKQLEKYKEYLIKYPNSKYTNDINQIINSNNTACLEMTFNYNYGEPVFSDNYTFTLYENDKTILKVECNNNSYKKYYYFKIMAKNIENNNQNEILTIDGELKPELSGKYRESMTILDIISDTLIKKISNGKLESSNRFEYNLVIKTGDSIITEYLFQDYSLKIRNVKKYRNLVNGRIPIQTIEYLEDMTRKYEYYTKLDKNNTLIELKIYEDDKLTSKKKFRVDSLNRIIDEIGINKTDGSEYKMTSLKYKNDYDEEFSYENNSIVNKTLKKYDSNKNLIKKTVYTTKDKGKSYQEYEDNIIKNQYNNDNKIIEKKFVDKKDVPYKSKKYFYGKWFY